VRRVDEWVQVTVEDDGRGWDPASLPKADRPHFGLQTMRERAESLGGTLDIDTAPGRGARIAARVPAAKQP
jgi:signal transduction histidine kinase